jgi:hypothetical protein
MDVDEHELVIDEAIIHKITESHAFIASTVDHIMQNTNLSELVAEVDSLKTENKDLRSLLTSQQEMMNGMNTLLFTLLNKMHRACDSDTDANTVDEKCGGNLASPGLDALPEPSELCDVAQEEQEQAQAQEQEQTQSEPLQHEQPEEPVQQDDHGQEGEGA